MGGQEMDLVEKAFESNYIAPLGPMVNAFEETFSEKVDIPHAVALSSGTAALHIALRIVGAGPGDEVFSSTLTFIGGVSPIVFQGATPVFVDSDQNTWNMDPALLIKELARCQKYSALPKAVVVTDLYGQPADLATIHSICDEFGVPVISDTAEGLGALANGRHAGAGSMATIFSFNGNKIITSSGGGMLCSQDGEFIEQARFLSQQARDEAPHYEHSQIGYNYRMSNIVAAIGLGQLACLDQRVARKREIYEYYRSTLGDLPGLKFMPEADYGQCTRWLTVVLVDPEQFGADRETIRLALEEENIESRPVWKPMHQQPVFRIVGSNDDRGTHAGTLDNWPARKVGGEVADALFANGLCLPSGTAMTINDLERITQIIRHTCKR